MRLFSEKLEKLHMPLMLLTLVLAVLFRIVAINWGMPHGNLHPDEGIIYYRAYENVLNHTFEVHEYSRPNHVTIKLNTLLYLAIQEIGFSTRGLNDFDVNFNEHLGLFITASRLLIAAFSLGTVLFAYLISKRFGKNQALFASLIFAVFPAFVEHSHYITPDIPLLFFLLGTVWASLKYMDEPSNKWLFWMCFFTAAGFCEKYPGIFGCLIIAVSVIYSHIKSPLTIVKKGIIAILLFLLGIMVVSPILIVDFKTVLNAMIGQNHPHHLGADGLNFFETIMYYGGQTAVHVGLILLLLSIYGIVRGVRRNFKETLILLTLFVYLIPISVLKVHWERYTLPLYADCILFAAAGLKYLLTDLNEIFKKKERLANIATLVIAALAISSQMAGGAAMLGHFLAPDSRIALQETFANWEITEDNTAHDCNTPLDPGGYYGAWMNFEYDPLLYKYGGAPAYVMTSSAQRDLYFSSDQDYYGVFADFYRKLDAEHDLVSLFTVENPQSHFVELVNIWDSLRTVRRYMKGAMTGYEIRLYRIVR